MFATATFTQSDASIITIQKDRLIDPKPPKKKT